MGAFGSRDSYLGDAADPATLNRYAYACLLYTSDAADE